MIDQPLVAIVTYSPALANRVAKAYLWRHGKGIGAAAIFLLALLAAGTWLGMPYGSWPQDLMAIVSLGAFAFLGLIYWTIRRRWLDNMKRMGSPEAKLLLTDETIGMESGLGIFAVPWRHFTKLCRYPDFWVLESKGAAGWTIPLAGLDAPVLKAIEEKFSNR